MEASTHQPGVAAVVASEEKPSGPVAAVMLASGIGALVLGILTTLAEASTQFKDFLEFNVRVGPLSGKVLLASGAFFAAWLVLGFVLRRREVDLKRAMQATVVLVALGFIGTFPTFFQAFAED